MYWQSNLLVQISRFSCQALVGNLFLVLGKIMLAAVDGNKHAVADASNSLLWRKGHYTASNSPIYSRLPVAASIHHTFFLSPDTLRRSIFMGTQW